MRIWDVGSRRLRLAVPLPPSCRVQPVFRPGDGAVLVNGGSYSLLIDPATGQVRTVSLPFGVSAFSHDGNYLAVAGGQTRWDGPVTIHLLDARTSAVLQKWDTSAVIAGTLEFSADDSAIKMSGEGGKPNARIYMGFPVEATVNLRTGKLDEVKPTPEMVKGTRFPPPAHPQRAKVAADLVAVIQEHNKSSDAPRLLGMYLSPDGKTLLVQAGSGLEAWDLQTGRRTATEASWPTGGHVGWTDGGLFVWKYYDGLCRWDPTTGKLESRKLTDRPQWKKNPLAQPSKPWEVAYVAMAPDGEHFIITTGNTTCLYRWSQDRVAWSLEDDDGWGCFVIAWENAPKPRFVAAPRRDMFLVEADSGKIIDRRTVTADADEKIWGFTRTGEGDIALLTGHPKRCRAAVFAIAGDRIQPKGVILDERTTLPCSVAWGRQDDAIYISRFDEVILRLAGGQVSRSVNLGEAAECSPRELRLDPSGTLLCASDGRRAIALDAKSLKPPKEAACLAGSYNPCVGNPIPLNDRVAVFARFAMGRIDFVDVRQERVALSFQTWGQDGWAAFAPDGSWIADEAGAGKLAFYKGPDLLAEGQARELNRPEAVAAALRGLTASTQPAR